MKKFLKSLSSGSDSGRRSKTHHGHRSKEKSSRNAHRTEPPTHIPEEPPLSTGPPIIGDNVMTIVVKDHPANLTPLGSYTVHANYIATSKFLTSWYEKHTSHTPNTARPPPHMPTIEVIFTSELYLSMYLQWAYHRRLQFPRSIRHLHGTPDPAVSAPERESQDYLALTYCLLLAHRLEDMKFKNAITEHIVRMLCSTATSADPNQFVKHLLHTHTVNLLYAATRPGSLTRKLVVDVVAEFGNQEDFELCREGDEYSSWQYSDAFVRDVVGALAWLKSGTKTLQKEGSGRQYLESV